LSTDEIMATFQDNNKNLLEITSNFKLISKRLTEGEGSIGRLLSDETIANTLQMTANRLHQTSANAQKLTADISKYTAALQSEGSLTNELVTDTVVFARLKASMLQLQHASSNVAAIADDLKLTSTNIKETSNHLNSTKSPIGVLLNDEAAGKELKATLVNLQAGTKKLDENMEAIQHNFLLRGFFKKKKKDEEKSQVLGVEEKRP
jgi:phospholipid/cholesterol/gamma-HCH transport system substrate-binding protein